MFPLRKIKTIGSFPELEKNRADANNKHEESIKAERSIKKKKGCSTCSGRKV